jgi:hypothetical protein
LPVTSLPMGHPLRVTARKIALATPTAAFILTLVIALPLLNGHVFLLDWHVGSHGPLLSRATRGLDGGVAAGLPGSAFFEGLARAIGPAAGWMPFALFFPLAAAGVARLVGDVAMSGRLPRVVAGIFYAANPFVFERIAVGQVGVLLGYALLPFAIVSLLRASQATGIRKIGAAGWWAAMAALSVHFLWIAGLAVLGVVIARRVTSRAMLWAAATIGTVAVLSAYLFFSQLGQPRPVTVGASDVAAYATRSDARLGLFGNVLGLYGFWRQGPRLPKDVVPIWPALLVAILVVAAVGAFSALRDAERRPLAGVLLLSGTAGYFLALGTQGPTGPLFRFLFDHVPLFQVMREPQKFLCLTALAYAVLFGWGAQQLLTWARQDRAMRLAVGVLVVALPLAYSPTFVNGLSGQVRGVNVPAGFAAADRLMGDGPGQVLVLPWHQYLGFPWSHGVIANPAPVLFHRDVIVGDNVELPGVYSTSTSSRSGYLQSRYAQGAAQSDFGSAVAAVGVRYVVVAKTLDWQSFDWLHDQHDLRVALDTPDLTLFEVTTRVDLGARVTADGRRDAAVVKRSPVRYDVPAGAAGTLELAEPYDPAWRLGSVAPTRTPQGTMSFPIGPEAETIKFTHWPVALAGDLISVGSALALIAGLAVGRHRRRRR